MAAVYLDNSEIRLFYDVRRVRELLTDDGTGDDLTTTIMDNVATEAGKILYGAILWASSEIDAKCQNGRRYSRADLEQMITDAAAGTDVQKKRAAVLKKMTADLAFGQLVSRRAQSAAQVGELAPNYEAALERLEQLYEGTKVFDLDATLTATVPTRRKLGRLVNLLSKSNEMFGIFDEDRDTPYYRN